MYIKVTCDYVRYIMVRQGRSRAYRVCRGLGKGAGVNVPYGKPGSWRIKKNFRRKNVKKHDIIRLGDECR